MHTTLCFDFGNTRLKYAVFRGPSLESVCTLRDGTKDSVAQILDRYQPTRSILASVIDHDPEIEQLLRSRTRFHLLSVGSHLPFSTPVGRPETIGADRLALAAAAVHFHKGHHNLVVGLGSCITYNFINKFDNFIGGSISPGKEMRLRAMHSFTAKLPLVSAEDPVPLWDVPLMGTDTRSNILSGVLFGMAAEIEGIISKYAEKFRNFNVLLTGGDAAYFARILAHPVTCDPDLLFRGLFAISEINATSTNFGKSEDETK